MQDKAIAPAPKRPRIIDVDVEQELRDKIRRQDEEIFRLKVFGEQTKVMEEVKRKMEEEKKTMEGEKKNFEEAKKNMEEEKKNMEEQKKAMEEEKKLAERMEGELRGLIECPVCLNVPRGTRPIPVCSNGHIVCHPCKDRIRQDTLLAKCPSCMVDLGNATSLIASRLVERVRHECENDGCEEMFNLTQLESHEKVCLFRKVLCPGRRVSCKLEMPFNKVKEHVKACPDTNNYLYSNNSTITYAITQEVARKNGTTFSWKTMIIPAHDKTFYLKHKREKSKHIFETMILGSEDECSSYLTSVAIRKPGQDQSSQIFTKLVSQPRPIDLQNWGDVELSLSGKAMSEILVLEGEVLHFNLHFSVEKIE